MSEIDRIIGIWKESFVTVFDPLKVRVVFALESRELLRHKVIVEVKGKTRKITKELTLTVRDLENKKVISSVYRQLKYAIERELLTFAKEKF